MTETGTSPSRTKCRRCGDDATREVMGGTGRSCVGDALWRPRARRICTSVARRRASSDRESVISSLCVHLDWRRRSCPLRRDSATGQRRRCASPDRSSSRCVPLAVFFWDLGVPDSVVRTAATPMVLILLIGSPCTRSIFRILWCIASQQIDAPLICVTTDQGAGYRAAAHLSIESRPARR